MGLIKEILLANFTNCWKLRPDNAEDNQQLIFNIMDLNQFIGKTKGVLTIVSFDKSEQQKTNQKEIIANCQCSKCGAIVQVKLDRIVGNYKLYQNACKECKSNFNIERAKSKLIGQTCGVLTVLEFAYMQGRRMFFKCICNRCGGITIVRSDRFGKGKYVPQSWIKSRC